MTYHNQEFIRPHHVSVRTMLEANGIVYLEEVGSPSAFLFEVPATNGNLSVAIRVVPIAGEVIVYSGLHIMLNRDKHELILQAIAWINTGLRRSCFELDQDRGQLVCRTTLWTGEEAPSKSALEELLRCNLDTADHYQGVFCDIVENGLEVREAVTGRQHTAGLEIS
ncbi:YbjN domain-containing protein [Shewanella frigidimarina]|uniref:YbjN domain-containing protein n=1 Tax=Shewanella frigidimarina TaxID=56812 RepID=A0A106C1Z7_SHEFR|nr:YbjN domain-containing protein [Shewanella frigidimarina]KVX02777.1 hypothetical protein AWJ07_12885 [Shewanella frigidimarina]